MRCLLISTFLIVSLGCASTCRDQQERLQANIVIPSNQTLFVDGMSNEPRDLAQRRPVVNLADTAFATKFAKPGYELVGNLYHNGQFYIARIPTNAVKNVYYQLAYHPMEASSPAASNAPTAVATKSVPGATGGKTPSRAPIPPVATVIPRPHSVLRFEFPFEQPVELVMRMPDALGANRIRNLHPEHILELMPEPLIGDEYRLHNLAISAEPLPSPDQHEREIVRLLSMEVRFEDFFLNGGYVSQIRLKLPTGEGDTLLHTALELSTAHGLRYPWTELSLNGGTIALQIIDSVLPQNQSLRGLASLITTHQHPNFDGHLESLRRLVRAPQAAHIHERPMQLDRSMAEEAHLAFESSIIHYHREMCPIAMPREICQTLSQTAQYFHLPLN